MQQLSSTVLGSTASAPGSAASSLIDGLVAFVFCIYVLANKETLARQIGRLARAWLPARLTNTMSHVFHVCEDVFQQFIVGQTTEAVILGTLCGIGMAILRTPYAPMVGALVGVTALIPYVGAFLATIVGAFMILTVNPFKGIFFDDDDFEHMSCSIEASWGKIGTTEIRICDHGELKKVRVFAPD